MKAKIPTLCKRMIALADEGHPHATMLISAAEIFAKEATLYFSMPQYGQLSELLRAHAFARRTFDIACASSVRVKRTRFHD